MRMVIVGAGMAGLACAEGLRSGDHAVVLIDKGRGPGGRMSTRRMATAVGDACFDHGAQYFTVRDEGFRRRVSEWIVAGAAAPWGPAGADAYVGVPSMNGPVRQMAAGQTVRWSTRVHRIERRGVGWRLWPEHGTPIDADGLVIALPAEQAADLLSPVAAQLAARARSTRSQPCWTAMLAFAAPVPVAADCHRSRGVIGWAARNNSKPERVGPESWVVQAGPEWSTRHLEADAQWVAVTLEHALAALLGTELPASLGRAAHRWRYARSGAEGSGAIWDRDLHVGICGDWLLGPRVEAAWLSGTMLASQIMIVP